MSYRFAAFAAMLVCSLPGFAQQSPNSYVVPRTEHGQPDFQGVWMTNFVTMMERPGNIEDLVLPADAARELARNIRGNFTEGVTDPDFELAGQLGLAMVNGEYRSSIVVIPEDGRIPWTEAGLARARQEAGLIEGGLDGPEQRPLEERCLASLGYPPIRALPIELPRIIVQNRDHLVFFTEDSAGLRLVHINGSAPGEDKRRFEGYSTGVWEGDTLVVTTTHFRGDFPARLNIPLPILIGANTTVEERFTRVAADRLHYWFTVTDEEFYSQPWSGEYSFAWMGGKSYEYGCHEGNYSLPGALRAGVVQTLDSLGPGQ